MQEIPSEFWMVIVSVITIFLCFVLYHLATLLKESKKTIVELKKSVNDITTITSEISEIVDNIRTPVNQAVGVVQKVSSIFSIVSGIREGFKSKEE